MVLYVTLCVNKKKSRENIENEKNFINFHKIFKVSKMVNFVCYPQDIVLKLFSIAQDIVFEQQ